MVIPPAIAAGGNLLGNWFDRYGFQTVIATILIGVLIYQMLVTDTRMGDALQRSYDLERENRTVLVDIQVRLGGLATAQAEIARSQAELTRQQADLARSQADTVRAMERLNDRLFPVTRGTGGVGDRP